MADTTITGLTNASALTGTERVPMDQAGTTVDAAASAIAALATATTVGLGSCNNTADLAKPISTATQTALNLKANNSGTLAQFAATTSAQLLGVISDETGTGSLVFATSPTLVTPALGTPASGTLTNCTGLPFAAGVSNKPTTLSGYGITDGFTQANVRTTPITGYVSTPGTVAATDTILEAIQKLNANDRTVLTTGLSLYVNGSTGSDSNSGLSTITAFQTIQAAVDAAYKDYDTQGNNITINVATGSTYTGAVSVYGLLVGVGTLVITGTGGAAIISTTATPAFTIGYSARVVLSSFDIRTTTSGNGIQASSGAFVQLGSGMIYGVCAGAHIESTNGSDVLISSNYTINGSALSHWHAPGGAINANGIAITLSGTPNFSAYFLGIATAGVIQAISGTTFTGSATGTRYLVHHCGILRMDASVDIKTFIPGSLAGAVIRGGVANGQVGTTAQNGDGSLAQGNARGSEAVDWQVSRYGSTFVASGTNSVVGGGLSNLCSGAFGTVAGGVVNIVDSNLSWVPGGQGALTRGVAGRGAWCSGSFITNGDAQSGEHILRNATSNATQTTLTTDGSSTAGSANQVFVPSNAVYMARILVSTRQTGGSAGTVNDTAGWDLNVYVKRGVAASTVVIVGGGGSSIAPTYSDAAAAGWRLAVVADTTNGALSISGSGEADKNIRWVARVISVEVT